MLLVLRLGEELPKLRLGDDSELCFVDFSVQIHCWLLTGGGVGGLGPRGFRFGRFAEVRSMMLLRPRDLAAFLRLPLGCVSSAPPKKNECKLFFYRASS